ncbi:sulfur reduction protein DsrS [Solemya velesiana gill symbiont]|uniref:Sulfur reduction protein DsrS n=1 Tax=Solemya velesiana gill symbiont TaxID=1918948 RepID=A0A1T2KXB2_9GAMM|nr:sulfur reduction protein DsrS [Solemya velesiana gill symbiont]OOZ37462.1 sulfur reduction protein DsrS [Solemya velesiana gill symbiont]
MELTSEDALRLNVLLANKPLAIRIHDSSMALYGLLENGEATVKLNPEGNDEKYLKVVRAFLSEKALGSPGGYPLYLQRWTRQGQMQEQSLEQLLQLGDPQAVFAVVCAEGLTVELARRAWWAAPDAENARRMLQTGDIVAADIGKEMADYLVEYLPFETDVEDMMESVRMAAQPGLLSEEKRQTLWEKSARKTPYLVGFIAATPDDLPEKQPARNDHDQLISGLSPLAEGGNRLAELMIKVSSSNGQGFLHTVQRILSKPPTQEVVNTTLDIARDYFKLLRPEGDPDCAVDDLIDESPVYLLENDEARACLDAMPSLEQDLLAMRVLSGVGWGILRLVLSGSTAMGSLMRRKLEPVLTPVNEKISRLSSSA